VPSLRPLLLLPLVLAAVLVPGAAQSAATATALNVTVGPGFSIKVADANGKTVSQLDPGVVRSTMMQALQRGRDLEPSPGATTSVGTSRSWETRRPTVRSVMMARRRSGSSWAALAASRSSRPDSTKTG